MCVRIDRAIKVNLQPFSSCLCCFRKSYWTNEYSLLSSNIAKQSIEFLDSFHVNRSLIIFTINDNLNFILTNILLDQNVNLALTLAKASV